MKKRIKELKIKIDDKTDKVYRAIFRFVFDPKIVRRPKQALKDFDAFKRRRSFDLILSSSKELEELGEQAFVFRILGEQLRIIDTVDKVGREKMEILEETYGKTFTQCYKNPSQEDRKGLLLRLDDLGSCITLTKGRAAKFVSAFQQSSLNCMKNFKHEYPDLGRAVTGYISGYKTKGKLEVINTAATQLDLLEQISEGSRAPTERPGRSAAPEDGTRQHESNHLTTMTKAEQALGVLAKHPEWSNTQIAKHVGMDRTYLQKCPKFKKARAAQQSSKNNMRRGFRDERTGNVDAEA